MGEVDYRRLVVGAQYLENKDICLKQATYNMHQIHLSTLPYAIRCNQALALMAGALGNAGKEIFESYLKVHIVPKKEHWFKALDNQFSLYDWTVNEMDEARVGISTLARNFA